MTQVLVAPVREGGTVPGYVVGNSLMLTPFGVAATFLGAIGLGLRSTIGSPLFEAERPASTYEPLPDGTILAGFRRMLETRRVSVGDRYYHALHRQLAALLSDEEDLADAGVRPSLVSFAGLLEFVRSNDGIRHPGLSLDRQGRFVAAWQPCGRAKLSITFDGIAAAKWTAANRAGQSAERGSGPLTMMSADAIDPRFRGWLFP